ASGCRWSGAVWSGWAGAAAWSPCWGRGAGSGSSCGEGRRMDPITPGPILAAEDSPDDLFLLQRAFEKAELKGQAEVVRDGVEATDYLEGAGRYTDVARFRMPSGVVLDLKMPRRSGFEVLSWMGERGLIGRIPAIILT